METVAFCPECSSEVTQNGIVDSSILKTARIPDDGVIKTTCERGHHTITIIQQQKFEILSQMAIKAIADGYYREAVASFASALERLYEFFIQATCRKNGIDTAKFEASWKPLSNSSERQLGAFIGIYLTETGQAAKLLPQKQVSVRNSVIHKGKFPERDETLNFGQAILECALPILELLKSDTYSTSVDSIIMESIVNRTEKLRTEGVKPLTMCFGTLFNLAYVGQQDSIETAVNNYIKSKSSLAAAQKVAAQHQGIKGKPHYSLKCT